MGRAFLIVILVFANASGSAQTINTTCTLYPSAAYCTSSDGGAAAAAQARQQQYETGQAIGSGIGMAIYRARFPGWRRGYCSKHPGQPFHYGNARGDSITGTCPSLEGLAQEAAAEFVAKNPGGVKSLEHAAAIDKYIADNNLKHWEPKSYEKAAKATANLPITRPAEPTPMAEQKTPQANASMPRDVFVWFDEPAPAPDAPLFDVVVSARAYDGALNLLRQARKDNTTVQGVVDTNYHPATVSLVSWQESNSGSSPTLFYWQGEEVDGTTPVMHFSMTKRAYEQMLALMADSDLRARPAEDN